MIGRAYVAIQIESLYIVKDILNNNMTGKEKCEILRAIRQGIAKANGIEYHITQCTFQGECLGYCPKCDEEARMLEMELNRLAKEGKEIKLLDVYPNYITDLTEKNEYQTDVSGEPDKSEDKAEDEMGLFAIDDFEGLF